MSEDTTISETSGINVHFDVPSDQVDGNVYFYVIQTFTSGVTFFKFQIVIDSAASTSSVFFISQLASSATSIEASRVYNIPETSLCSDIDGPITAIVYKVGTTTISSTTNTDNYYLADS